MMRFSSSTLLMSFLLPLAFLTGCSTSDDEPGAGSPTHDASAVDAQPDGNDNDASEGATPDAGHEAGPEAGPDATNDVELLEAGPDAPLDSDPCVLAAPYSSSDPVCNECAEKACCEEINACLTDPECDDSYVNCMLACVIDAEPEEIGPCIAICDEDYPIGKAKYDAAIQCADTHCATECG
jgi:hypothetical protein